MVEGVCQHDACMACVHHRAHSSIATIDLNPRNVCAMILDAALRNCCVSWCRGLSRDKWCGQLLCHEGWRCSRDTQPTHFCSAYALLCCMLRKRLRWRHRCCCCCAGWPGCEGDAEQRAAEAQGRGQDAGALPVARRCCCCCCCWNWLWNRSLLQLLILLVVEYSVSMLGRSA
jgi:hypothetical protein